MNWDFLYDWMRSVTGNFLTAQSMCIYTIYNDISHTRDVGLYSLKLSQPFQSFCGGSKGLTICLRNVIREVLGGLRSSLLSFTSVGSGLASPSSLRSTVCRAESTSSDFIASTGESHTTWIILPGNKTVKKKTIPPNPVLWSPSWPFVHLVATGWNLWPFPRRHIHIFKKQSSWCVRVSLSQCLNSCQIDWLGGKPPALRRYKA